MKSSCIIRIFFPFLLFPVCVMAQAPALQQGADTLFKQERYEHYAGVPNIVYALWRANDQSGAELMTEFYKQIS